MLLALVFVIYCAGETYLRLTRVTPSNPAAFHYSMPPFMKLDVITTEDVPGLPARRVRATWNGWGLRGDPINPADEDQIRIITVGGSVTECLLLPDDEGWPAKLQQKLEARTGKDIWVGNAAASGQQAVDYSVHLRLQLRELRPHLVIAMLGANDLQAACEERLLPLDLDQRGMLARYARGIYWPTEKVTEVLDALEPSYTYFFATQPTDEYDLTKIYTEGREKRAATTNLRSEVRDLDEHLDAYRANLVQLAGDMNALPGAKGLFMSHPSLWKADMTVEELAVLWAGYTCAPCENPSFHSAEAMAAAMTAFNKTTLEVCAERGLACFDVAPLIERSLDNFYDDAHLKEPGAEALAEALADFLVAEELLQ